MRMKAFQCAVGCLSLLGTVCANIYPVDSQCTIRAWARAPDLAPDTIVQGDARIKLSAGCPDVESVLLGLRLKERSFIKALRSQEDRKWMHLQQISPWVLPASPFSDPREDIKFQEMLTDKDLWVVREEERIVFETTQVINVTEGPSRERDVVQDFAVLVPSTNFPPALDYLDSGFLTTDAREMANVEFMYEYFVRVLFANGTTVDITAGYTGFHPLYDAAAAHSPRIPSSETTELEPWHIPVPHKYPSVTNYTAQVSGLELTRDSENQAVTVTITRTGPARTFTAPLTIWARVDPTLSSKWAVEYDMPSSQSMPNPQYVLSSKVEDVQCAGRYHWGPSCYSPQDDSVSIWMPNSTVEEIQSRETVTTMSEAITIPTDIHRLQITNFDTYYQTLANSLEIMVETPRTEEEAADPDDPFTQVHNDPDVPDDEEPWVSFTQVYNNPDVPDDEEPWVPWEKIAQPEMYLPKSWGTYSGSVPVVVHPTREVLSSPCLPTGADTLDQMVLSDKASCEHRLLNHYLDEGARGPVFVDPGATHELLAKDPAGRQLHAPILEPVVSSPPEGGELAYRYYHYKHPIYVGETWAKKVANKGERKID